MKKRNKKYRPKRTHAPSFYDWRRLAFHKGEIK